MIISMDTEKIFSKFYYILRVKTKQNKYNQNFSDKVIVHNLIKSIIDKSSEMLKLFVSEEGTIVKSMLTYTLTLTFNMPKITMHCTIDVRYRQQSCCGSC